METINKWLARERGREEERLRESEGEVRPLTHSGEGATVTEGAPGPSPAEWRAGLQAASSSHPLPSPLLA